MDGSNDVQDSTTAADMRTPVQETGDGATESSIIVGNVNGINSSGLAGNGQTFTQICASNAEIAELGMDETSSLYAHVFGFICTLLVQSWTLIILSSWCS